MYGYVFEAIKAGVIENYSTAVWYGMAESVNTPLDFEIFSDYDEKMLCDLASAFAAHFRFTEDNAWEYFGGWYIKYLFVHWKMEMVARDAYSFFKIWNDFQQYKLTDFPNMLMIYFKVYEEGKTGFRLAAVLSTKKYSRFILGFVNYICGELFNKDKTTGAVKKSKVLLVDIVEKQCGGQKFFHNFVVEIDNAALKQLDTSYINEKNLRRLESEWEILFPFFIYADQSGTVLKMGISMEMVIPDLLGKKLGDCFKIEKPLGGDFEFEYMLTMTDSIWELVYTKQIILAQNLFQPKPAPATNNHGQQQVSQGLQLSTAKEPTFSVIAQVVCFEEHKTVLILARPKLEVYSTGMVYLSDTSPNDSTRAIVTISNLKQTRMTMTYDELVEKNKRSEILIRKYDEECMKKDDFLFEVMPPTIINSVRGGAVAFHSTIKQHENVAVILSDICGFTKLSNSLEPLQVVDLLSCIWEKFDRLVHDLKNVSKIETIGDAYMVAAGVPEPVEYSALAAAIMAVCMNLSVQTVKLDFIKKPITSRIGVDIGTVVAGIVGHTNPRYGIYGETVNYTQQLETASRPQRILISKDMKIALSCHREFRIREAKNVALDYQVYWLNGFYDTILDQIQNADQAQVQLDKLKERLDAGMYKEYYTQRNSSEQQPRKQKGSTETGGKQASTVQTHDSTEFDNMMVGRMRYSGSDRSSAAASKKSSNQSVQRVSGGESMEPEDELKLPAICNIIDEEPSDGSQVVEVDETERVPSPITVSKKQPLLSRFNSGGELMRSFLNKIRGNREKDQQ